MGLVVNIYAADDKYPVVNRESLAVPIEIQLLQKQETFSDLLSEFLKSTLNFQYFEKNNDSHRFSVSEITDSQNVVR